MVSLTLSTFRQSWPKMNREVKRFSSLLNASFNSKVWTFFWNKIGFLEGKKVIIG
jgi:hypothetical protein